MAPQAALGLALLGSALFCMMRRRLTRAAQAFAILATLIGMFNVVGFVYGSEAFYRIGVLTPIAMASAVALIALGLGVLLARPEVGLLRSFTSDAPGIHIINWLLFATLVMPVLLDWIFSKGESLGFYGRSSSEAFSGVGGSLILMILIWYAGKNLVTVNEQLEHRVRIRTAQLENTNVELKHEIAERGQAEARLRLQGSALESAANAIVITDANGVIEWANPAFSALTRSCGTRFSQARSGVVR
jgi:PAS domain-containing protein